MAETVRLLAVGLAEAFVQCPWTADELAARAKAVVVSVRRRKWIYLTRRVVQAFPDKAPRTAVLVKFLEADDSLLQMCADCRFKQEPIPEVDFSKLPRPEMRPAAGAASTWNVRPLVTIDEVAQWLELAHPELDWFADCRRQQTRQTEEKLRHYRYRWIAKTWGGRRLLEIPKPRLMTIQRQILSDILNQIPPHPAAHAFRRGRSVASYVAPHTDKRIVLYTDLCEFFPSVRGSQVHAIFRTAGYPDRVASVLTGLCTNRTPGHVFSGEGSSSSIDLQWKKYGSAHLPQGAPTSPALANLVAFWLDCRLTGLAKKVGADYTRYADDLVFSGGSELARCSSRFQILVAAIAHHEGFAIRRRKTREMTCHTSQQVAGITLNRHPNMPRRAYDNLRAILHNCQTHGPETQNLSNRPNFRDHLQGRIAYWLTICPNRGAKLRAMYQRIKWD